MDAATLIKVFPESAILNPFRNEKRVPPFNHEAEKNDNVWVLET